MRLSEKINAWAKRIKRDAVTLWFAYKHPGTPLAAKALCLFVVAYALSPIDLVPDFIPVLGYVDDALLLPALIWLSIGWCRPPCWTNVAGKAMIGWREKGKSRELTGALC